MSIVETLALDEDWLADVIDDSLDMDWTGRVGARAIVSRLREAQEEQRARRVCSICGAVGDADHKGYCSESW